MMKKHCRGTLSTTLAALLVLAASVENSGAQSSEWSRSALTFVPDDNTSIVDYGVAANDGSISFQGNKIGDITFFGPVENGLLGDPTFCLAALDPGPNASVQAKLYAKNKSNGVSTVILTLTSIDALNVVSQCAQVPMTLDHFTNNYYFRVRLSRSTTTANLQFHMLYTVDPIP